jgi:flagellar basal-body rod modification protein FlgD
MTAVSEITSNSNLGLTASVGGGSVLGKDDFLQLLVTQLQNQDPLNPSDPTEFTAQLAQFSSLEQLFSVNENLAEMSTSNCELERLSALSLIGREVVAEGSDFHLGKESLGLGYRLEQPASEVKLYLKDQNGRTVATLEADELAAGDHFLAWDGTDENGQVVPSGDYTLMVSALCGEEEALAAVPLVKGVVSGVDLDGSESLLVTSAGDFRLTDVQSVREI